DVADADAPFHLAASIGPVDVLINNAGVHYDTWETALKPDWRIVGEAFETNLFGAWRMAQGLRPGDARPRLGPDRQRLVGGRGRSRRWAPARRPMRRRRRPSTRSHG